MSASDGPGDASAERRRIAQVYGGYDDPTVQARWSEANAGNRAIIEERDRALAGLLAGTSPGRVLELGCGDGQVLAAAPLHGAARFGVDVLGDRLDRARVTHPGIAVALADGRALPFRDGSIDTTLAFTVLSSILDDELRAAVLREVARVTGPGGRLIWYDLRRGNPRNSSVRAVGADEMAALLPCWQVDAGPLTLLPPLARRLGVTTRWAYPTLARAAFLRTHLIGSARAPGRAPRPSVGPPPRGRP